ncbi:phage tail tape measure protein [Cetobacterium sp.]|uniref:phage tail tape measure protein n=1 Tax=Cetobacterium sp. TaxID=2071632 RepID=UPI003F2F3256
MANKLADVFYEVGYKVNVAGLKKADGELLKVDDDVKKVKKGVDDFGDSLLAIGSEVVGIVAIGSAIIGTAYKINQATNLFAEFDYQLAKVNAKGDQTTESFNVLKQAAFEAGKNTVFSSKQAAQGLEYMAMAGWSAVDSAKALPAVLDTAVVAGEDLALVSDIMTDTMTVFKLGADQANHFADVLAYSANKSNTSIGMMGEAMKYAAPPMSVLGSSAEETAALFMSMADGGIKASQAGTALRASALRLVNPTKEANNVMRKLRLQTKDSSGNFIGMTKILEQLELKTKNMTNAQKAQTLSVLFGTEAVSGIMVALEQGTDKIKKNTEALKNNQGYARKSAEYMANTLQGQILATASKQEALSLKIGETFAPAKLEMVKTYNSLLDSMLTKLTNNTDEVQKLSDFTVGFISIMTGGMKFVGKAIEDAVILPLKFAKNTLDILTFGQFSKSVNTFVEDVAEIGERKRAEQEFYRTRAEKFEKKEQEYKQVPGAPVREKKSFSELTGYKPTFLPTKEKERIDNNIGNIRTGGTIFSPSYNLSGMMFNFPQGTNLNNPKEVQDLVQKTVIKTLEDRDKRLMNQIDPRRR